MLRFIAIVATILTFASTVRAQSALTFDASHRMRYVGWDAGLSGVGGAPVQFIRNRTRAGLTWRPAASLELRAALVNEFFNYLEFPTEKPFNIDEVAFEHLYVKWQDTLGFPLGATVGRQEMRLGDGFLIMDGSPLDGSRTLYVNGARLDLEPWQRQRFTLFYLHQPMTDDLLPIINDRDRPLAEYTRDIAGVYYDGTIEGNAVNAYAIRAEGEHRFWMEKVREGGEQLSSTTIGLRIETRFGGGFDMRAELAFQDLRSHYDFGWSSHHWEAAFQGDVGWSAPAGELMGLSTRFGLFSYSDGWEPLLGRWPKWNESMVFSRGILVAPGYWSNLNAFFAEASLRPCAAIRAVCRMQQLQYSTPHNLSWPGLATGDIGRLLALYVFWKPDLPVSALAMLEHMWYADAFITAHGGGMPSSYTWGRVEVMYALPAISL
ncbi:MAG: hypothetical protein IH600_10020 [Bacteroidetes bacterium]|nr:hypothetical protein [Bacteroidota bacterium]